MKYTISFRDIGAKIKKARKDANLTQAVLAEMAGYSTAYIANIERGSNVSLTALYNLAQILQVSMDYLLGNVVAVQESEEELKNILKECTPQQREFLIESLIDLHRNLKRYQGMIDG